MSSSAQILANQKNATSSTGPRTDAGKATSSQNAASHGLTGSFRVLPHENQAAFDACLARYREEFQPTTEHERFLVELMTQSRWELQRTNRLIAAVLERLASAPDSGAASPDAAIAAALIGRTADAFTTLKRYAAAAAPSWPPSSPKPNCGPVSPPNQTNPNRQLRSRRNRANQPPASPSPTTIPSPGACNSASASPPPTKPGRIVLPRRHH